MTELDASNKHTGFLFPKIGIIALLLLIYVGLGIYFHSVIHTTIVYPHFGYIPILLAGMWWGRKGIFVAVILCVAICSFHLLGFESGELWSDVGRSVFYMMVAACIGILSENMKKGKIALNISEEKYRNLTEKSLVGFFVYRDEKILFINQKLLDILGMTENDLIGKSFWRLLSEEDMPKIKEMMHQRNSDQKPDLYYECRMKTTEKDFVWVEIMSSMISYEGNPAILVNVHDVSARKKAEEKQKELESLTKKQEEIIVHSTRLAELGEMSSAIAHEINQPLTSIRNFAKNACYMMEHDAGTMDEVRKNLEIISGEVDRARNIITHMRTLTRRSKREEEIVNINDILIKCTEFLEFQMKLSGVEIFLDLDEDMPVISADRIQLEQVFLNILTNARLAMQGSKTRELRVRTSLESHEELPVVVEIADSGKGFTPEQEKLLFEPFYSSRESGKGTGLGLAISLRIIKEHRGGILASGQPGKGAVFTIRLPLP